MSGGIWRGATALYTAQCLSCGKTIRHAHPHTGRHCSWSGWSEQMLPGEDCEFRRTPRGATIDGSKPVEVYWAWHPMGEWFDGKIMHMIRVSYIESLNKDSHRVVVVKAGPGDQLPDRWCNILGPCVDQIVAMPEKHFSDAQGPFPSLRAELTMVKTMRTLGMSKLTYYWPTLALPVDSYKPVFDDATLAATWSEYARLNIQPKTQS